MRLQKIIERLQKLHSKKDLSLDRVKNLCEKLGNPQDNLDCISVIGTNGKYSTIQTMRAILEEANINYNVYSSPHVQKINERFIYNNKEIDDNSLANLLGEVEEINNNETITFYEILTSAFFYGANKFDKNINIVESTKAIKTATFNTESYVRGYSEQKNINNKLVIGIAFMHGRRIHFFLEERRRKKLQYNFWRLYC